MSANDYTRANEDNGVPHQAIIDAHLNVFGLQLLIESFTELAKGDTRPLEFTYLGVKISLQIAPPANKPLTPELESSTAPEDTGPST